MLILSMTTMENSNYNRIYLDPSGGISGDIFSASLISMGADSERVISAMVTAGKELGEIDINPVLSADGATQLRIDLKPTHPHIKGQRAKEILISIFDILDISPHYRAYGFKVLEILMAAEKKAHSENQFLTDHIHANLVDSKHHDHHHHDHHGHSHDHHHHHHDHDNESETVSYLHEAQDIVIDIVGAVTGMQSLNLMTQAILVAPLNVGGGIIRFSHGEMPVPAPATKNILEQFEIQWRKGPVDNEICTPTGSALLAALDVSYWPENKVFDPGRYRIGQARGSRILDIPPFKIYGEM